jgi:hypothetical protein
MNKRKIRMKVLIVVCAVLLPLVGYTQDNQDKEKEYKKRVLETTELDFLMSYYTQDGDHAAVSGGQGTEELTNLTPTFVVSIPLNEDDVLTIDAGISAYTSASSSNVNPFDRKEGADPFQASSGASQSDALIHLKGSYSHSSDDRNKIWSVHGGVSNEYDYFSIGIGGSYTRLFNEKNTEITLSGNMFLDKWTLLYPAELDGASRFEPFMDSKRNSYSAGVNISQILSRRMQGSIALDVIQQDGLLSSSIQRVYFSDIENIYVENFPLADDVERLPDKRFKMAIGVRLNYYINQNISLRTFYRYYTDDWGIRSHTASIEIPIKIGSRFTIYPSYRYYDQTKADHFAPFDKHLSSDQYYTSDYDLSEFNANQFGFGVSYTDIFTSFNVWKLGLKSIDLKYQNYDRSSGLNANLISLGVHFIFNPNKQK